MKAYCREEEIKQCEELVSSLNISPETLDFLKYRIDVMRKVIDNDEAYEKARRLFTTRLEGTMHWLGRQILTTIDINTYGRRTYA